MQVEYTPHFRQRLSGFPRPIQDKFQKQIEYLLRDVRHPSLRAKKFDEEDDIWQARVDRNIRFYFKIRGNCYVLLNIKRHGD